MKRLWILFRSLLLVVVALPFLAAATVAVDELREHDVDAVAANGYEPTSVWINDGGANFVRGQVVHEPEGKFRSDVKCVELGDLDGDGDLDIVFGSSNGFYLLLNNGEAVFDNPSELSTGGGLDVQIVLSDLNGDGRLDALVRKILGDHLVIVWNEGDGTFREDEQFFDLTFSANPRVSVHSADVGDVDGDNDVDVVLGGTAITRELPHGQSTLAPGVFVYLNDGLGKFAPADETIPVDETIGPRGSTRAVLGDVDGDKDLDVVVESRFFERGEPVVVRAFDAWLNNGQGHFDETVPIDEVEDDTESRFWTRVTLADVDGDGDLGVFAGGRLWFSKDASEVFLFGDANRDRQFSQHDIVQVLQSVKYLTGESATWAEGDWNSDGVFDHRDIIAALATGNYMQGPYATE